MSRDLSSKRLTPEASRELLRLIWVWMERLGIQSVYELYLLGNVRRSTLYRWFSGRSPIPINGVQRIGQILAGCAENESPLMDLDAALAALMPPPRLSSLRTELRERRLPYDSVLDAVAAAACKIVPIGNDAQRFEG